MSISAISSTSLSAVVTAVAAGVDGRGGASVEPMVVADPVGVEVGVGGELPGSIGSQPVSKMRAIVKIRRSRFIPLGFRALALIE